MQESLITFETAKLAKEKGFNIPTRNFYADFTWKSIEAYSCIEVGYNEFTDSMEKEHGFGDITLIPTQSLLQKWLREVHEIYANSKHDLNPKGDGILYYTNWGFINNPSVKNYKYRAGGGYSENEEFKTYEEALELGLQEGLKLII